MRYWTPERAQEALPEVQRWLAEGRIHLRSLRQAEGQLDDLRLIWGPEVRDVRHEAHHDFAAHAAAFESAGRRLAQVLAQFDEMGVEVKDLDTGLVDFRTDLGGREVFLCWREGEQRITHWHTIAGGFAGRRPIPQLEPPQV